MVFLSLVIKYENILNIIKLLKRTINLVKNIIINTKYFHKNISKFILIKIKIIIYRITRKFLKNIYKKFILVNKNSTF